MPSSDRKPSFWQRAVEFGVSLLDGADGDVKADGKAVPRHKLPERANATVARVRQVDETSCGVAAAAMFARQPHSVVKAFMFPLPKRHYRTHYKDVWRALSHFGVTHEKKTRKFEGWKQIPGDALVFIRWKGLPERDAYHWVIFQRRAKGRNLVIDPGSWGSTLTDIDLATCKGISYALATPRTREQGPGKAAGGDPAPAVRAAPPKVRPVARPKEIQKSPLPSARTLSLGRSPASSVRASEALVDEIASVTKLTRGAVVNRANKANGRKHARVVYADRWPSRLAELGAEPAGEIARDGALVTELARLLDAQSGPLASELSASPKRAVREVLIARWPDAGRLSAPVILAMTVQQVRAAGQLLAYAEMLRVDSGRFSRRLKSAHGSMSMAKAFADLLPEAPHRPKSGLALGRYELTGREWQGGFGVVREAWERTASPNRMVVLKWPHGTAQAIKALEGEYERARELRHPALVGYFEIAREAKGRPVLVIEHGGTSLREYLETKRFSVKHAVALSRRLAEALDYLIEEEALAHLDLHPGNILIDADGEPRITDFGISRHVAGPAGRTVATSMVGGHYPRFAAPEVESGKPSRRSDQFSLALVFLSCVCGIEEALEAIEKDELPAQLSREQVAAFNRARSESSAKRFPSCKAFTSALIPQAAR